MLSYLTTVYDDGPCKYVIVIIDLDLEYMIHVWNAVEVTRRMTLEEYDQIMTVIDDLCPRNSHLITIPVIGDDGVIVGSEVVWLPESVSFLIFTHGKS